MCQYDLGYNLYCSNDGCENVHFVIQEQFLETFPVYKRLFAKYKQPCDCPDRWYQWHYYATQNGRYKRPFVKLCDGCVQVRKAEVRKCNGNVTEDDKTRIRSMYPTHRREPYPRNGKPPTSLHKGFIQEHDIETGIPKAKGRVINHFAYDSDDGTSVSGKSTPRAKAPEARSETMRYLEDSERPTEPVITFQRRSHQSGDGNASEICSDSEDDESDTDWGRGKGSRKGKERERTSVPPPGTEDFHRMEDTDLQIDDENWARQRAALLRVFDYASYSDKVDRADADLEAALERGSEVKPDDGQTESSVAPTSIVSSSVVSSSAFSESTVTSVPSRKRSVRFRDESEDEYESASKVSSAMDRLRMQGRRR